MFVTKEANDRLEIIAEMIDKALLTAPMLNETERMLRTILAICQGSEDLLPPEPTEKPLEKMIISCDASIKENPGGPAAMGAVIQFPTTAKAQTPEKLASISSAKTNNEAEYEAVYFALTTVFGRHNNPTCLVEVRSDSQLVINQLNGDMECHEARLANKRDAILEFVRALPVPVKFKWFPRNSTPELRLANYLSQDQLGVPRH